ncbi:hypothetical protein [Enterocloster bolteae]|jgi:hypothetical protein|uniref:hypothetical protein n=1 Tax=Enterocloster bolteae TaxID=208479 RepID=UPI00266B66D5|nr:hypothetical protein [Enterocloster bolteae]
MPTDKDKDMVVYSQKDILVIGNLINSLEFKGVEAARKIATIGTLLETGKPLENYLKERSDEDGTTEQDGQGDENAV